MDAALYTKDASGPSRGLPNGITMSGHALERAAWFLLALAGGVLALAPAGALPLPLAGLALTLVLAIAPGAWLARHVAAGDATDARAALALLLSPFAAGALIVLPRLAGVAAVPAARAFAVGVALLAAWEALRPHRTHAAPAGDRSAWALAVGAGVVLLAAHVFSPALAARSDGSFHAGVVWAASRAVPPEDPFFAGLTLRYAWGLHAWAAAWVALAPRLGAYAPLEVTSALAAVSALLAVGALARRLGAAPGVQLGAQALALAGATPFAWLVLAARAAAGEVRGGAELARALEHGADSALRSLDPGLLHPSLVLPLDKFVVLTPFAWALAGAALLALALDRSLEPGGFRAALRLALVVAAALFVHPAGGLALAASALVGALLAAATAPAARRALVPVALSLAGGVMVAAPYVRAISGSGGGVGLDWGLAADRRGLVSAIVAGAFLLPWAAWQLAARRPREPGATALAGMLAGLVVPACLLRFPGDNQSKLLDLALLLAAAPAALAWAQLASAPARRVLVRGGLVVAFAPTLAAALWAYAHERETSADAPSRPPAGLVSAVRAFVPPAAWLVDATLDTTRGAAPALPGETGRALVWSGGFMARKWGYADSLLSQRRAAAESLARGQWPPAGGGRWLRALDPELWLIAPDDSTRATTFDEHVVARARGVKLARISGLL